MSSFTQGNWIYYSPYENDIPESLKDCDIFFVQGNIAHFIGTISTEKDSRLITAIPELYNIVQALANCQPHQFSALKMRAGELLNNLQEN